MKNKVCKFKTSNLINSFAVILILVATFFIFNQDTSDEYYRGIFLMICITIILAVSLNLTCGCLGEMVLGHAAFASIGAYTAGILLTTSSIPDGPIGFIVSVILGGIVASIFGFLVGIPALRLKGDYLAIITLGFGEIIKSLIQNIDSIIKEISNKDIFITGGSAGLKNIPLNTSPLLAIIVLVIVIFFLFTFMRSKYGRTILAIREDDIAAQSMGINVTKYKVITFVIAAFIAGIAGAMYAQYMGSIVPQKFDYNYSIEILVIVVLGGLGSFTGSIISAIILVILPEALRGFADYRMVVYAIALLIVMLTRPTGLLGRYEFSLSRTLKKIKKRLKKEAKNERIGN